MACRIWTNAGKLLIGPLGTNFSEFLIVIHTFSFNKMHLKMSSAKWRPFCLGLNVLTHWQWETNMHQQAYLIMVVAGSLVPDRHQAINNPHADYTGHCVSLLQNIHISITRLWPSDDTIWQHRSGSTLTHLIACWLMVPSHCPSKSWLIIKGIQ